MPNKQRQYPVDRQQFGSKHRLIACHVCASLVTDNLRLVHLVLVFGTTHRTVGGRLRALPGPSSVYQMTVSDFWGHFTYSRHFQMQSLVQFCNNWLSKSQTGWKFHRLSSYNQSAVSVPLHAAVMYSQRVKYLNWMKQTKAAVIVRRPMANDNREVIRFQRLSFRSTWPTHLLPSPVARRTTAELWIYGVYFRILEDEDKCTCECVRITLIL